jgi:chorismate synthase
LLNGFLICNKLKFPLLTPSLPDNYKIRKFVHMAGNTFGTLFRLTTFGESHGQAIGGVVDGCPAGMEMDLKFIQHELDRRRPGQSALSTPRNEADTIEFLSGIFEGKTTGAPIAFIIRNTDQQSADYDHLKDVFRPSHADYTYQKKYGFRDYRGGGRSSARETLARVAGGAIARLLLLKSGISIQAFVNQVGPVVLTGNPGEVDLSRTEENPVRCPDPAIARSMVDYLDELRKTGDTAGGVISCVARHVPAGLGEPVFDKLNADLAKAMLSINAARGFEIGEGFASASMKGSEHNDIFTQDTDQNIVTLTNHSGGIQGGISNGELLWFRVAFKPVATLMHDQPSVNSAGEQVVIQGKGRHDVCVVPRAVPIVEAMAALVLADHLMRNNALHSMQ